MPSSSRFYIVISCFIFVMIFTHQIFWSPIHGDGAVYSNLIKEFHTTHKFLLHWRKSSSNDVLNSEKNLKIKEELHKTASTENLIGERGPFLDHPYFFFLFSLPFVEVFDVRDWSVKLPNIFVAFLCLSVLFLICSEDKARNFWPGILACYFLALNPTFELQTRQPMLDPLAQMLAFASVYFLYKKKFYFLSGILLGFAFLTKGLELLPNLAASSIFMLYLMKRESVKLKSILGNIFWALIGLALPILVWIGGDILFDNSQWLSGYYSRQFAGRFFSSHNTHKPLGFNFIYELVKVYEPQFILFLFGSVWLFARRKIIQTKYLLDLWIYSWIHIVFVCLAFILIKKVALQHYTGIFLSTSAVLGLMGIEFFRSLSLKGQRRSLKISKGFAIIIFLILLPISVWYWITPYNKQDLWGRIQQVRSELMENPTVPIVVDQSVSDYYGVFYTGQWYWPNPIFHSDELNNFENKEHYIIRGAGPQDFNVEFIAVQNSDGSVKK